MELTLASDEIEQVLALLAETPRRIAALTGGLERAHLHSQPDKDAWSANEILAHLRANADIWGKSILRMIAEDHPTIRYVSPRGWMSKSGYAGQEFSRSLQVFTGQRAELLSILSNLAIEDWSRRAQPSQGRQEGESIRSSAMLSGLPNMRGNTFPNSRTQSTQFVRRDRSYSTMDLYGKVALVTGGAIRVGKAITLELARAGADIVINYNSSAAAAQQTATEIEALGRRSVAVQADVSHSDQVRALVDRAVAELGRLDVLVNSASLWKRTPWAELDEAEWDRQLAVDLKGPFLCSQAAAPHLAAHGDGAIVNIVDLSALNPFPNFLPHSVAKAGLLSLTYGLAMELAPKIRVNAIAPGPVLPPPDYTEQQIAAGARRTLLQRWGSAEDVASAVRYLVEAEYVTGVLLPVDGGERLAGRSR